VLRIESEYEALRADAEAREPEAAIDPEDGLVILYTSGTTGFPKGALISQRAMIAPTPATGRRTRRATSPRTSCSPTGWAAGAARTAATTT
jgi:acyl-coenzyme A synthetase/AMP-(fatty) acid ligase